MKNHFPNLRLIGCCLTTDAASAVCKVEAKRSHSYTRMNNQIKYVKIPVVHNSQRPFLYTAEQYGVLVNTCSDSGYGLLVNVHTVYCGQPEQDFSSCESSRKPCLQSHVNPPTELTHIWSQELVSSDAHSSISGIGGGAHR